MSSAPFVAFCRGVLAAACALTSCLAAQGAESFGIAASDGKESCVAFHSAGADAVPDAALGRSITLIIPREPQKFFRASLGARLEAPCKALASADVAGPYFAVEVDTEHQDFSLAIAASSRWSVRSTTSGIRASAGRATGGVSFRTCTSTEGVHLTAWQGKPLKGRRVWHEYFYLGYDVEPSCTSKDVE